MSGRKSLAEIFQGEADLKTAETLLQTARERSEAKAKGKIGPGQFELFVTKDEKIGITQMTGPGPYGNHIFEDRRKDVVRALIRHGWLEIDESRDGPSRDMSGVTTLHPIVFVPEQG